LSPSKLEQRHSRALRRIRPGTPLHEEGFEKPFALIAQLLPQSNSFRPITLLDILDCWPDYHPGRVLGLGRRAGAGLGSPGQPPLEDEVMSIAERIKSSSFTTNISLLQKVDVLHQIALRGDIPQVGPGDFIEKGGEKWMTISFFANQSGLAPRSIESRIKNNNIFPIKGRTTQGNVRDFYPESQVNKACADLKALLVANDEGVIEKDGEKWVSMSTLSKSLKLSQSTIIRKIEENSIPSMEGRIKSRNKKNVYNASFYPESQVREACSDSIDLLVANDEGVIEKDGEKWVSMSTLLKSLELSKSTIIRKIEENSIPSMEGRIKGRNKKSVHNASFYPESKVNKACADLKALSVANDEGFIEKDGEKWAPAFVWKGVFNIDQRTIKFRAKKSSIESFRAISKNIISDFYSESQVRKTCADLIKD